ncbi:MAG: Histidine utilization repressor, partial [uncultured Microvirga sp.]
AAARLGDRARRRGSAAPADPARHRPPHPVRLLVPGAAHPFGTRSDGSLRRLAHDGQPRAGEPCGGGAGRAQTQGRHGGGRTFGRTRRVRDLGRLGRDRPQRRNPFGGPDPTRMRKSRSERGGAAAGGARNPHPASCLVPLRRRDAGSVRGAPGSPRRRPGRCHRRFRGRDARALASGPCGVDRSRTRDPGRRGHPRGGAPPQHPPGRRLPCGRAPHMARGPADHLREADQPGGRTGSGRTFSAGAAAL